MRILILLLVLVGCKRLPEAPPPIEKGVCADVAYRNNRLSKVVCRYDGCMWACFKDRSTWDCVLKDCLIPEERNYENF